MNAKRGLAGSPRRWWNGVIKPPARNGRVLKIIPIKFVSFTRLLLHLSFAVTRESLQEQIEFASSCSWNFQLGRPELHSQITVSLRLNLKCCFVTRECIGLTVSSCISHPNNVGPTALPCWSACGRLQQTAKQFPEIPRSSFSSA